MYKNNERITLSEAISDFKYTFFIDEFIHHKIRGGVILYNADYDVKYEMKHIEYEQLMEALK